MSMGINTMVIIIQRTTHPVIPFRNPCMHAVRNWIRCWCSRTK